jgi:hypothetical protein
VGRDEARDLQHDLQMRPQRDRARVAADGAPVDVGADAAAREAGQPRRRQRLAPDGEEVAEAAGRPIGGELDQAGRLARDQRPEAPTAVDVRPDETRRDDADARRDDDDVAVGEDLEMNAATRADRCPARPARRRRRSVEPTGPDGERQIRRVGRDDRRRRPTTAREPDDDGDRRRERSPRGRYGFTRTERARLALGAYG